MTCELCGDRGHIDGHECPKCKPFAPNYTPASSTLVRAIQETMDACNQAVADVAGAVVPEPLASVACPDCAAKDALISELCAALEGLTKDACPPDSWHGPYGVINVHAKDYAAARAALKKARG